LACHRCNTRHYNFTTGIDKLTQTVVSLYHPRQQLWAEHFVWTTPFPLKEYGLFWL
jgi:hypothetical protein